MREPCPITFRKIPKRTSPLKSRVGRKSGKYVHSIDPYGHVVSIHNGRSEVEDPAVLDYDMLQTGHGDRTSIPNTGEYDYRCTY